VVSFRSFDFVLDQFLTCLRGKTAAVPRFDLQFHPVIDPRREPEDDFGYRLSVRHRSGERPILEDCGHRMSERQRASRSLRLLKNASATITSALARRWTKVAGPAWSRREFLPTRITGLRTRHVASAYPPNRTHRAVPPHQSRAAVWRYMGSRARRLPLPHQASGTVGACLSLIHAKSLPG
jgi:hypothetical protein